PLILFHKSRHIIQGRQDTCSFKWKNEQLPSHKILTISEQLFNNTSLEAAATPVSGSTDATSLAALTPNPPLVLTTIRISFARTICVGDARRMRRRRDRRLGG
ncbi:uncharacterized protein Bfra_001898, partial [Botrytis fragariae]